MNRLRTRIYSAMANGEHLILDQLDNDIRMASETGRLDTEQYTITFSNGFGLIYDKVNREYSEISISDDVIELKDYPNNDNKTKSLSKGDKVSWTNADGTTESGVIQNPNVGDNYALITCGHGYRKVNRDLLTKSSMNTTFSKSRARKYLVDQNNNLIAFGWEQSLGRLAKLNPSSTIKSEYDINKYRDKVQAAFSNFSLENQKLFTKPYRRYVILDQSNKYVTTVDVTNAKGIIQKNPTYTAIKEVEYNKSRQPSLVNQ